MVKTYPGRASSQDDCGTGIFIKKAINDAIHTEFGTTTEPVSIRIRHMGLPATSLDKGLTLAAAIEDEETIRKLEIEN
ncbi:hypothetical protein ACFQ3B_06075 [Stackebrandtia endophytica]|uniref:hypothetical protein n=1 Tax=Stackebrandtia endophytica TaxID=1496996 RepID=UPI00115214B7|nr:hypothetical protein [Stackebrandtia endophytica]